MGDVRTGQVWEPTPRYAVGRVPVEVVRVEGRTVSAVEMNGERWPGSERGDGRRTTPGRMLMIPRVVFGGESPRYRLVEQPGPDCAYCRVFSVGSPQSEQLVCECEVWCGADRCGDHPEARAREIAFARREEGDEQDAGDMVRHLGLPPGIEPAPAIVPTPPRRLDVEVRLIGDPRDVAITLERLRQVFDLADLSSVLPTRGGPGRVRVYVGDLRAPVG